MVPPPSPPPPPGGSAFSTPSPAFSLERGEGKEYVRKVGGGGHILLFPDTLPHFVESVGHDGGHAEEVVRGAEAARGQVALHC